jgi:hypothetical protein
MRVNGGKKTIRTFLDISPLFFHIVPSLVQSLVIMYDEIFQAVAVEADVLILKPFLDSALAVSSVGKREPRR